MWWTSKSGGTRQILAVFGLLSSLLVLGTDVEAGPTVVPTTEGQIGETPGGSDRIAGPRFESIRGQAGELIFGGLTVFGGAVPPPPEIQFLTDRIHAQTNPAVVETESNLFNSTFEQTPSSAWARNAADDGDFVAFSFAVDGSMPQTMTVRIATFDENGTRQVNVPIASDVPTFSVPGPAFQQTGVTVDAQGRVTVAYTDFPSGVPQIRASRVHGTTGAVIDPDFLVNNLGNATDVALLDPSGNRLIVPSAAGQIQGNILDMSGGTPVVLPEFTISTTPGLFNDLPKVAADPATGQSMVVWEHYTNDGSNPVDIRARRFDAAGNPIEGSDFVVNTTTMNAQGQPDVATGNNGLVAVVWAGDSVFPGGQLDVFLQIYDAQGQPLGGETRVNTTTSGFQDRPTVGFLPESDPVGRPQVVVAWRDVSQADGSGANGTGKSYKCFSIEGLQDPSAIFADGFESGDTTSWSDDQP